jgi:hypothetical protein
VYPETAQEQGKQSGSQFAFTVGGNCAQVRKRGGLPHPAFGTDLGPGFNNRATFRAIFFVQTFLHCFAHHEYLAYEITVNLHQQGGRTLKNYFVRDESFPSYAGRNHGPIPGMRHHTLKNRPDDCGRRAVRFVIHYCCYHRSLPSPLKSLEK